MRMDGKSLLIVACLFLVSCQRHVLPSIKDPELLRKDCEVLYREFPIATNTPAFTNTFLKLRISRNVPKEQWPPSIRALKPRVICTDYFGVSISIYENSNPAKFGHWAEKGYYLQFNTNASAPRTADHGLGKFHLKASPHKGIDEFSMPSIVL